ncbi:hypothetical protein ACWC9Q_35030 [Streptomyces sp. NPDC001142]
MTDGCRSTRRARGEEGPDDDHALAAPAHCAPSGHEDLADDVRGLAELAEWERIAQLLAVAAPGTVCDPDPDPDPVPDPDSDADDVA